jgi:hypothetical protein
MRLGAFANVAEERGSFAAAVCCYQAEFDIGTAFQIAIVSARRAQRLRVVAPIHS